MYTAVYVYCYKFMNCLLQLLHCTCSNRAVFDLWCSIGIYPLKDNHHSIFVKLSWHPSDFGVWCRCLPHVFNLRKVWKKIKDIQL